jgi:aspartate/methionine/tyrosine aminotransferase
VISINSFSKYFSMTGWRLGWLVLPPALVPAVEKLAQNLYICASSIAQRAALACFEPESIAEYEGRREAFRARRDLVVPALNAMGLTVPVAPDGAFYAWADCSRFSPSSWDFCIDMMRRAHVALTPGPRLRPGRRRALPAPVVRQQPAATCSRPWSGCGGSCAERETVPVAASALVTSG